MAESPSSRVVRSTWLAAVALALAVLVWTAPAQAQDHPSADELIDRYVELIGGADAFREVGSRTTGSVNMPSMGISGTFEIHQSPPNRMVMRQDITGIGEMLSGYDGEIGWSINPMTGPSLMEGAELAQTREQASVAASLRERSVVPGRETVGESEYDGNACWQVELTWDSGRTSTDCYSMDSGLLIASEMTQASQMGEIRAVTLYHDYREFDGRLIPTRMVQRAMGQEQILTIETVEYGEVDPERFALPPAIQTLVEGDGGR